MMQNLPDGFDLVDTVLLDQLVEAQVQLVEHPHHLDGSHLPGHGGEAHNVREENGD